jgi:hypothetical protein
MAAGGARLFFSMPFSILKYFNNVSSGGWFAVAQQLAAEFAASNASAWTVEIDMHPTLLTRLLKFRTPRNRPYKLLFSGNLTQHSPSVTSQLASILLSISRQLHQMVLTI